MFSQSFVHARGRALAVVKRAWLPSSGVVRNYGRQSIRTSYFAKLSLATSIHLPGERATRFVRLLTLISFSVLVSSCGGGGSSAPAPTVSLKASATDVATNGSVTLSWASTEASSCTATGGWSGSLSASGSKTVSVPQTSTSSISCSGAG